MSNSATCRICLLISILFLGWNSPLTAQNFATYFGGVNGDNPDAILHDDSGNVYYAGRTSSPVVMATPGAHDTSYSGSGGYDAYLAKFTKDGQLIWSTYYGGTNGERPYEIALDKDRNIVMVGFTASSTEIATPNGMQTGLAGNSDGFLCKFSPGGALLYGTYFGGSAGDQFVGIDIDTAGNYIVIGTTASTLMFNYPGVHQAANKGSNDAMILKFSPAGSLIWATYYGGSNSDNASDVCVDKQNNIYVAISTASTADIATPGADVTTNQGGSNDLAFAKFTPNGALIYGTYKGGPAEEAVTEMVFDHNWNLVFTGQSNSKTGMATSGAFQDSCSGPYDGFLGSIDTSGHIRWLTYVGGTYTDLLTGLCVDNKNDIYIMGTVGVSDFTLSTPGAFQETYNGHVYDGYFAKFTSGGNRIWSSYYGGINYDLGNRVKISNDQKYLYMSGLTYSASGIATPGAYQTVLGGSFDTYLFRFSLPVDTCSGKLKAGFTVNKNIQCTKDNQFIFTDTTSGAGGTLTHYWDFGNGSYGSNAIETQTFLPATDNMFTVKLVSTLDGKCSDSAFKNIYLIPNPAKASIQGNAFVWLGSSQDYSVPARNGSTYKWIFKSGNGNSFTSSIRIKWMKADTVNLQMVETGPGGCLGDTAVLQVIVKDPTGIEDFWAAEGFSLFPNPSSESINVIDNQNRELPLLIYNTWGKVVYEGKQSNTQSISLRELPDGLYHVSMGEQGYMQKLLIIH